ncbi:MAG: YkgJ family cysteine cluster protein [Candidatus Micrarchaeia archaeon]|jgi:Fe-S-cluster containining protein
MEKISKSIVNACRHCTARCCRGLAVVLSIPEALRLLEATCARPEDVLEFTCNVDSRKTPHYPLFVARGKEVEEWFIIIRRLGRDCIFLQPDLRCGIYLDRPYVCRLYPFELDGKTFKKGALCPVKFAREPQMEKDADALVKDLVSHEVAARKWCKEHGEKGEVPDIRKFLDYFKA